MKPAFSRTPKMFFPLILALALFVGPSTGVNFFLIPDFNMEEPSCKYLASSLIKLDNNFVGVASIFFPQIRLFAKKYDTFAQERTANVETLPEQNSTSQTLVRKKRFGFSSLISESLGLISGGTLDTLARILENKFVDDTLDKIAHVGGMYFPCTTWLRHYIYYWYNILSVILNEQTPIFFDA